MSNPKGSNRFLSFLKDWIARRRNARRRNKSDVFKWYRRSARARKLFLSLALGLALRGDARIHEEHRRVYREPIPGHKVIEEERGVKILSEENVLDVSKTRAIKSLKRVGITLVKRDGVLYAFIPKTGEFVELREGYCIRKENGKILIEKLGRNFEDYDDPDAEPKVIYSFDSENADADIYNTIVYNSPLEGLTISDDVFISREFSERYFPKAIGDIINKAGFFARYRILYAGKKPRMLEFTFGNKRYFLFPGDAIAMGPSGKIFIKRKGQKAEFVFQAPISKDNFGKIIEVTWLEDEEYPYAFLGRLGEGRVPRMYSAYIPNEKVSDFARYLNEILPFNFSINVKENSGDREVRYKVTIGSQTVSFNNFDRTYMVINNGIVYLNGRPVLAALLPPNFRIGLIFGEEGTKVSVPEGFFQLNNRVPH